MCNNEHLYSPRMVEEIKEEEKWNNNEVTFYICTKLALL